LLAGDYGGSPSNFADLCVRRIGCGASAACRFPCSSRTMGGVAFPLRGIAVYESGEIGWWAWVNPARRLRPTLSFPPSLGVADACPSSLRPAWPRTMIGTSLMTYTRVKCPTGHARRASGHHFAAIPFAILCDRGYAIRSIMKASTADMWDSVILHDVTARPIWCLMLAIWPLLQQLVSPCDRQAFASAGFP